MEVEKSTNVVSECLMKRAWRLWAKALGEKATDDDKESDIIAIIRTVIVFTNFVTCFFIIANIVHNW